MAKSSKSKTRKSNRAVKPKAALDTVSDTDAVEVSSVDAPLESVDAPTEDALVVEGADIPDDEDGLNLDVDETTPDLDMEIVDDAANTDLEAALDDDASNLNQPAAPEPAKSGSTGFFPLLLGGVAAGAIGYGIATYFPSDDGTDDVAAQIAALEAQVAAIPQVDLTGVEQQITDAAAQSTQQIADLTATTETGLQALDARLVEVEKRPGADGTLSDVAMAAYQQELQDLRAELDIQQQSVMSAAAQAEADLAAARAQAETLEQQALDAAEAASTRAALNRIGTAIETGAPFDDALSGLPGDVPPALSAAAANGVATDAQLADEFPDVARAALATARSEGASDDAGGIGGFFRSQFDVRSTAPREGSDPDAILSRAEAAVKEGRVNDALAEIDALPEVARAEMTDWTAQATERADVLDALATLSETYN